MSLDRISPLGFNRHDIDHIVNVARDVDNKLQAAGADPLERMQGMTAAFLHDLGNLFSRSRHSLISARLFELIFQPLLEQVEELERNGATVPPEQMIFTKRGRRDIQEAIELHDEKAILPYRKRQLATGTEMRLPRIADLLLIADKTDLDSRVSYKAGEKAIHEDEHYALNRFMAAERLQVAGTDIVWDLRFLITAQGDDIPQYQVQKTRRNGERRLRLPDRWYAINKERHVPFMDTWVSTYFKHYSERLMLTCEAMFRQYPEAQSFTIDINDGSNGFTRERRFVIRRGQVEAGIAELKYWFSFSAQDLQTAAQNPEERMPDPTRSAGRLFDRMRYGFDRARVEGDTVVCPVSFNADLLSYAVRPDADSAVRREPSSVLIGQVFQRYRDELTALLENQLERHPEAEQVSLLLQMRGESATADDRLTFKRGDVAHSVERLLRRFHAY
jgi:hypothetical protein